ncbi:DUF6629 family protein [Aeromicrobium chenweiae]|uniref:Uncharacterized protein n=1 Tax=Aeromicrobium chenweiae TaxID=2079793 RepID=A0A2S0WLD1_9ACTN|nr:DUF6629 family protein [Aeromicrobium chenweiae]AWB92131.1 hypothetical protein C3E78_07925 [Aeromicrobium chenweiae]TGN32981.1 hypothetical protein E4L97_09895 [Aeromicrobium chenweiae]
MCFSTEADLVAGIALLPVAALSLREVRCAREVPFAALPLLFAAHQLTEALVWAGLDGDVSASVQKAAAMVYVLFAFSVLPTLVPAAVLLLEPRGARLRVAPFVALGVVVSAQLTYFVLNGPLVVEEHAHAVEYQVGLQNGTFWAVLYIVAVVGPSLLSGYPSIVAFGALNLVGLTLVAILYREAFASVWCVVAALLSVLVLLHMYRRRRLPDPHRLRGEGDGFNGGEVLPWRASR